MHAVFEAAPRQEADTRPARPPETPIGSSRETGAASHPVPGAGPAGPADAVGGVATAGRSGAVVRPVVRAVIRPSSGFNCVLVLFELFLDLGVINVRHMR